MSATKIVLFNGPPKSGKDFAASLLCEYVGRRPVIDKFARILKESCHAAYGIFQGGRPAPHDWFEKTKDQELAQFFGLKPRQVYIAFSETYMKKQHGAHIFGALLLRDIRTRHASADVIAISDSGFREEAEVLVHHYGAPNCTLVRLHTPGTSFDGDSRNWVDLSDMGVQQFDVINPLDDGLVANMKPVFDLWKTVPATESLDQ